MIRKLTIFLVLCLVIFSQVVFCQAAQEKRFSQEDVLAFPFEDINNAESAGIEHVLKVQKLNRDIYLNFFDTWKLGVFSKLANFKQHNIDLILTLIKKYNLGHDLDLDTFGKFPDHKFRKQYENFIKTGHISMFEALRVAGTLETLYIFDITSQLDKSDNKDICSLYKKFIADARDNLLKIKENLESYGEKIGQDIWLY